VLGTEIFIHDVWETKASELLLAGGVDCILMTHTAQLDDRFEITKIATESIEEHKIQVQVVMRAEREDFVVAAISRGVGISMMPKTSADLAGLATCDLTNHKLQRDICIVSVRDRPKSPLVDALVSHINSAYY